MTVSRREQGPTWAGLRHDAWFTIGIAAVLMLALLLRTGDLTPPSLWLDDAWLAVGIRGDGWAERLRVVVSAPGFVAALFAWLDAVGFSETAAQLLPLAFGLGGVWATIGVARRGLSMSRPASLLAGLVLATSPLHLTYSTRVKHYTLDALLTLLVLWAALAVLRRPERTRRAVVLGVTALAVTAVSGIVGVVAGAALAVAALASLAEHRQLAGRDEDGSAAVTAFACVVALGGWLAFAAWWTTSVLGSTVNEVMRAEHAELFLPVDDAIAARTRLGDGVNVLVDGAVAGPVPVFALLAVAGVVAVVVRRDTTGRRGPWRALLLLAPVVGAIGLALAQRAPWGLGRTELYLVPLIALLVGAAADVLVPARPPGSVVASATRRVTGTAVAGAIIVAAVAGGQVERRHYPLEDVARATRTWELVRTSGDVLLVYSASRWAFGLYTSSEVDLVVDDGESRGFHVEVADPAVVLLPPTRTAGLAPVTAAAAGHRRVWLLGSHRHADWESITTALREAGFSRQRAFVVDGGHLLEFVAEVSEPPAP